jgi:hypothetical protein
MALEKCPECGGQLSSHARTCPHCGIGGDALKTARSSGTGGCGCLLLLLALGWVLAQMN